MLGKLGYGWDRGIGYSRARRRLAALSALSALLFPSAASAVEPLSAGVGVFLGYSFGADKGFQWGFEGFAMFKPESQSVCEQEPRPFGFGPVAQVSFVGLSPPAITLAGQAGKLLDAHFSVTGELGLSYQVGQEKGLGMHLGVRPEFAVVGLYLRGDPVRRQASVNGAVRLLPTYNLLYGCSVGRPLRLDDGARAPTSAACLLDAHAFDEASNARRSRKRLRSDAEQRALAKLWAQDAQSECESIPAFIELAEQLMAVSAPEALVERAIDAGFDEVRHALACAALATEYAPGIVRPALEPSARRTPLTGAAGLFRLARESWLDGCLGEGAAAEQLTSAASDVRDCELGSVLSGIAEDERRHAELAWSILDWTLEKLPSRAHAALASSVNSEENVHASSDPSGLEAAGRLGAQAQQQLTLRSHAQSRTRAARLI